MLKVQQKLDTCKAELRKWNGIKHGNAEKFIKEKAKILKELQEHEGPNSVEPIRQLKGKIDFLLEQEDTRWKQWTKQNWYKKGDRNTPYFHAWASQRHRTNQIHKIKDDRGNEWKKPNDVSKAFVEFYQ